MAGDGTTVEETMMPDKLRAVELDADWRDSSQVDGIEKLDRLGRQTFGPGREQHGGRNRHCPHHALASGEALRQAFEEEQRALERVRLRNRQLFFREGMDRYRIIPRKQRKGWNLEGTLVSGR